MQFRRKPTEWRSAEIRLMRVLVATDAWHPQVNGVVRTLTSLARSAQALGVSIDFLSPEGFPDRSGADLSGLAPGACRAARRSPRRIEQAKPDAIHIATEGPIGYMVRAYCRKRGRPFTTSYTTRFPEYISARVPIPRKLDLCRAATLSCRRSRHDGVHAVADQPSSAGADLAISACGRAASTPICSGRIAPSSSTFRDRSSSRVGRIAVEKNLEAFLSLDLPGTKVVIGTGPAGSGAAAAVPRRQVSRAAGERRPWPRIWRRPTSSCFQAGRTRSVSCSSRRWPAAFRSPLFRSPGRRTSSATIRSAC